VKRGPDQVSCFACGELNTLDSRFCKFCGRPLVTEPHRPTVAYDWRNRLMLWLVIVLLLACVVFGIFGLLSSKILRAPNPAVTLPVLAITYLP